MFRPVRKRIIRIATVVLVISVLLFGLSVYSIEHGVRTYNDVVIPVGTNHSIMERNVTSGNDIEYSVSGSAGSSVNITAYLIAPNGDHEGKISFDAHSGSQVIVAGYTGNWTLVVRNNAFASATVDITISNIGYTSLLGAVFGFILLIIGIAMIGINSYTRYMERKREKNRGFSQ